MSSDSSSYALYLAAAIALILVLFVLWGPTPHEHFSGRSPQYEAYATGLAQSIHPRVQALFDNHPEITYTEFRDRIPEADAVMFEDARGLWRRGALTTASLAAVC